MRQAVALCEICKSISIIFAEPFPGRDPQKALWILKDPAHRIVYQTIADGVRFEDALLRYDSNCRQ